MKKLFDRIIEDINTIRPIDHIGDRFVRFNLYDEIPLKPLFEYLNQEKDLTKKLVGLINSHFSLSKNVDNISDAMIMLGSNSINIVVLVHKILNIFMEYINSKSYSNFPGEVIKHCIFTGSIARLMARKLNIKKKFHENYFLAGFLHDLGKIILSLNSGSEYLELIKKSGEENEELVDLEDKHLFINHVAVGLMLADHWKLSPFMKEAIAFHHRPILAQTKYRELTSIIYLSNKYNLFNQFSFSGNLVFNEINKDILNILSFNEDDFFSWYTEINSELEKSSMFLNLLKEGNVV